MAAVSDDNSYQLVLRAMRSTMTQTGYAEHADLIKELTDYLEQMRFDLDSDDETKQMKANMIFPGMWCAYSNFCNDPSPSKLFILGKIITELSGFQKTKNSRVRKNSGSSDYIDPELNNKPKRMARQNPVEEAKEVLRTSNRFENLTVEEAMIEEADNPPESNPNPTQVVKKNSSNAKKIGDFKKTNKIDPFYIHKSADQNWQQVYAEIIKITGTELCKEEAGKFVKVYPKDIDQFRSIQRFFTEKGIKGFALNPKTERPLKILIKGIPADIPADEVKTELLALGYQVQRISQLKRFKDKSALPIFLCNLYQTENLKEIFNTVHFLGFIVRIETYKFKGVKQCYRCQKWNHGSDVCSMDPVCLKCAGSHFTYKCDKSITEPAKCGNCQGPHPANYRNCPAHPDNIRAEKLKIKTIREAGTRNIQPITPEMQFTSKFSTPSISFSQIASHGTKPNPPAPGRNQERHISPSEPQTSTASGQQTPVSNNFLSQLSNLGNLDDILAKLEKIATLLEKIHSLSNLVNITTLTQALGKFQSNSDSGSLNRALPFSAPSSL